MMAVKTFSHVKVFMFEYKNFTNVLSFLGEKNKKCILRDSFSALEAKREFKSNGNRDTFY